MLRIRVQSQKGKVASCFMLTSEVAQLLAIGTVAS